MIISGDIGDKFTIRNRYDLKVLKIVDHNFGYLYCGLYYPEKKNVIMGISYNLIEFDYEQQKITKNVRTEDIVYHIEKVNDDSFLIGELFGHIELINRKDLT